MRKHIVITTFGSLGDINPYLALASGLKGRGHDPLIATSELYRKTVESIGIRFHPVRPDIDYNNREFLRRALNPRTGTEVIIREMLLPHIRVSFNDLMEATEGADLLITHPITFAGPIVAEKRRMPWVSTVLAPISFFSAHDLPVPPPFPLLGRLRVLGSGFSRLLIRGARRLTHSWSEPVRRLRADLGLPPGGDPLFEGQFSPHLTLAMFSSILAANQPDWPPRTRVTGFLFADGLSGPDRSSGLDGLLENDRTGEHQKRSGSGTFSGNKQRTPLGTSGKRDKFTGIGIIRTTGDLSEPVRSIGPEKLSVPSSLTPEVTRFLDSGSPPVVFTLGSSAIFTAGTFYEESARASRMLGKRALLLIGKDAGNRPRDPLPSDVLAVDYAPFEDIFPRAAAIVHQCGIGTAAQALRAGRPMIAVPFAHDQPDNASRLSRLGVARTIYPGRYTARRVAREIEILLKDPSYEQSALSAARRVQSENGVGTACDAIEEVLAAALRASISPGPNGSAR